MSPEVITATGSTVATAVRRRAISAACFGTFVEYYDFVIYGYVATYIAQACFPTGNSFVSLLLTFGAFAVSYVARPLGAVIFAPLGDRYGRRTVLSVVILLMTLASTGIGVLPAYSQIGVAAPVLLIGLRLVQGISAGGEFGGATSLIAEFAPASRRGFFVGFISLTVGGAMLFGSGTAMLLTRTLSAESMAQWGWRLPLLLSLPLGLIGLYIRFKLEETPAFTALSREGGVQKSPLRTTLRRDYRSVLIGIGIAATNSCMMALYFIYLPSALKEFTDFSAADAQLITFVGLVAYCAAVLPFARLSDRVGRIPLLLVSSAALIVLVYPSLVLLSNGVLALAVAAMVVVTPVVAANIAAVTPLLSEMFATDTRYTGLSLGWQMATTLFAGPTPIILAALAGLRGATAPAFYAIGVVALTMVAGTVAARSVARPGPH
ncbi:MULTISPECIES: MFS transporter [unclassified Rhodococcus (in: high G+C Gram-positive bacteria)]|uniref:MFS transporter n=1 Tax=unclassified Rhodococcus (in: high G+C Gram-positive bacteria) TaxID=192944 RepID=UPI00163ADBB7|nr:MULTISPECIES: MFS transporter [unclassified Rhodococcus (in: high G+C Gram-positive bacteria)]MBC2642061.1 MFS transporter [Rhodococcus sp. 3A]MBC2893197.1 MFS transporter [Rhodococcus sp. 4CII]